VLILPVQHRFTSLQLVLCASLAPIFSSNILLVSDLHTMLLKGSHSHDKKSSNSRHVLRMFDYFDYSS
jgi:hypothetical protein